MGDNKGTVNAGYEDTSSPHDPTKDVFIKQQQ